MKIYRWLSACLAASMLVACGGGGNSAGSSPFGGGAAVSSAAADLVVELSKATVGNTGSDEVIVKTTVIDAGRNALPGSKVAVSADSDAIVASESSESGSDGTVLSKLTIGANRANRVITVLVTSGDIQKTVNVQVIGAQLAATIITPVVSPGDQGRIKYVLTDQVKTPMGGQEIRVVATGLDPGSFTATTDAFGEYEFVFRAPATAGNYAVTATAGGTTITPGSVIQVQSAGAVGPISGVVASASVSANPSVVGVNQVGFNNSRANIRALFLGANNLPIQNVRVRFDLGGDLNSIGGVFEPADKVLYSDANGVVTSSYIPGPRSSPTDGVTVRACYGATESAVEPLTCTQFQTVKLTVSAEPLGVSIGTNEFVIVDELTYTKKFIVSVVDSAGVAKADVNITASVDLLRFIKGSYAIASAVGAPKVWEKTIMSSCPNEDLNKNGVAELGEDFDGDGRLEPGKSDVAISILHPKTRADGTAEIQVRYAKSFATWIDAEITVAASGVSGTEGRAKYLLNPLPAPADVFKNIDVVPAFVFSPYGTQAGCSNPN